jgi:hypothetical protein
LVAGTAGLALNNDLFANGQQRQKNINVNVVVCEVAYIDLRGAGLGRIIPEDVTISRIAGSSASVCHIKEQV